MSNDTLTVGQVARSAGIAPSAVRYYERIGLLAEAHRQGGWRRYPPSVLDRLRLIRIATAAGFSLSEVRVLLDGMDQGQTPGLDIQALARVKLPELEAALARTQLLVQLMRSALTCGCPSLTDCVARAEAEGITG